MIHGVGTPQYQGYGEKILVGSYLKYYNLYFITLVAPRTPGYR